MVCHLPFCRKVDAQAHALAAKVRALGVGLPVPVAVCVLVDRSALMVTGMLAVHKAGGCYVALDPYVPG